MKDFDFEFLNFLTNIINYIVFAFISVSLLGTKCFRQSQMFLVAFGLAASVSVQLLSALIRKF